MVFFKKAASPILVRPLFYDLDGFSGFGVTPISEIKIV
jgi:hypothetical protein